MCGGNHRRCCWVADQRSLINSSAARLVLLVGLGLSLTGGVVGACCSAHVAIEEALRFVGVHKDVGGRGVWELELFESINRQCRFCIGLQCNAMDKAALSMTYPTTVPTRVR